MVRFHLMHPRNGYAEGRRGCESFWSLRVSIIAGRLYSAVAKRKVASTRRRAVGIRRRKLTVS